jgi:chromosome segregation ATPase
MGTLFKGYKKRLEDAAKEPFIAGQAAMNAARAALELKDQQIKDVMDRDRLLHQQLMEAQAARDSQQAQVTQLYTQIGQLRTQNEQLKAEQVLSQERIQHLEATVAQLEAAMGKPPVGGAP